MKTGLDQGLINGVTLFERISASAREGNLEFLLIGGHAVNIYGYSRPTVDVDLLVKRSELDQWKEVLRAKHFEIFREGANFVQFASPSEGMSPPVDFMIVADETFEKLKAGAQQQDYLGAQMLVPSAKHLIALKLHVLKQNLPHRTIKDFQDIQGIVEQMRIDLRTAEMHEIFLRYGSEELYHRMKVACDQQEST